MSYCSVVFGQKEDGYHADNRKVPKPLKRKYMPENRVKEEIPDWENGSPLPEAAMYLAAAQAADQNEEIMVRV